MPMQVLTRTDAYRRSRPHTFPSPSAIYAVGTANRSKANPYPKHREAIPKRVRIDLFFTLSFGTAKCLKKDNRIYIFFIVFCERCDSYLESLDGQADSFFRHCFLLRLGNEYTKSSTWPQEDNSGQFCRFILREHLCWRKRPRKSRKPRASVSPQNRRSVPGTTVETELWNGALCSLDWFPVASFRNAEEGIRCSNTRVLSCLLHAG